MNLAMKRVFALVLAMVLSAGVAADIMAQKRDGTRKGRERVEYQGRRGGNALYGHPGNHGGKRPAPGHSAPGHSAPGYGRRPGRGAPFYGMRPEVPVHRHHGGLRPGMRRPPVISWHRPIPPRRWRPSRRVPVVSSVFGIAFGTAFDVSLSHLYAANYAVSGYGGNEVYLANVPVQGYYWPEATLYYSNGGLSASRFFYSTVAYDMRRYNDVYNSLYSSYGAPVSVNNMSVTWFGGNNGYITLDYLPMGGASGLRYYTTLTLGI